MRSAVSGIFAIEIGAAAVEQIFFVTDDLAFAASHVQQLQAHLLFELLAQGLVLRVSRAVPRDGKVARKRQHKMGYKGEKRETSYNRLWVAVNP